MHTDWPDCLLISSGMPRGSAAQPQPPHSVPVGPWGCFPQCRGSPSPRTGCICPIVPLAPPLNSIIADSRTLSLFCETDCQPPLVKLSVHVLHCILLNNGAWGTLLSALDALGSFLLGESGVRAVGRRDGFGGLCPIYPEDKERKKKSIKRG